MASPEPVKWITGVKVWSRGLSSWLQGRGRAGLTTAMLNEQLRSAGKCRGGMYSKGVSVFVVGTIKYMSQASVNI
jgi:hypothetical protein